MVRVNHGIKYIDETDIPVPKPKRDKPSDWIYVGTTDFATEAHLLTVKRRCSRFNRTQKFCCFDDLPDDAVTLIRDLLDIFNNVETEIWNFSAVYFGSTCSRFRMLTSERNEIMRVKYVHDKPYDGKVNFINNYGAHLTAFLAHQDALFGSDSDEEGADWLLPVNGPITVNNAIVVDADLFGSSDDSDEGSLSDSDDESDEELEANDGQNPVPTENVDDEDVFGSDEDSSDGSGSDENLFGSDEDIFDSGESDSDGSDSDSDWSSGSESGDGIL